MTEWLFLIHPLGPFSHQISILKNSNPPSYVMLCIHPVREKEWKSETKQNQMVNFKMATMTREISRPSFVWRPFTCAPWSPRTFSVVFQLWQPVGNLRAAILIFAIQFYDRKDDLDLNSSGQLQWLTGCKRLWTVFLGGLCWTRWQLRWRNVASWKHCLLATAMFPSTLFSFNLICIHDFVLKYKLVRAGRRERCERDQKRVLT